MGRIRTGPRGLLAAAALFLAAVPGGAAAAPTGAWGWHVASRGFAVVVGRSGDVATGVMVLDGTVMTLVCLDVDTGARGSQTVYAHWSTSGTHAWSKVDGLAVEHEVVEGATAGFSRSRTSDDHCGAGGVQDSDPATRFSLSIDR